jgi:hypothetical protein
MQKRRCFINGRDTRGSRKGKGRVPKVYDDVELLYPDARMNEKFVFVVPTFRKS